DLKAATETLVAIGQLYGPDQAIQTDLAVAAALSRSEKGAGLALTFIQKAEAALQAGPSAAAASLRLLDLRAGLKGAETTDLKVAAERYLNLVAPRSPPPELSANLSVARALPHAQKAPAPPPALLIT